MMRMMRWLAMLAASTVFAMPGYAATRNYYIAAADGVWDFAPSGQNLVHCDPGPPPCPIPAPWTDSHIFSVTRYFQYTDASFSTQVTQPDWLGILGPIIRAEVGDTVLVHFCNHATSGAYGMHPHGFRYTKDNEGAHYFGTDAGSPPGQGAQIEPGACFDYTWIADDDSGPGLGDPSSKVWWYHSHIDEPAETNAGLLGPIVITRRGAARADGTPRDVDREFVTAFFIFDKADGEEQGLMHSINGYIFGNLRGLVMRNGEKVRWYVLGMGNEVDLHTPHWHGKTLQVGGSVAARRTDVVELLPGSMVTADMKANNPGEWLYHCHVADHIYGGMFTTYLIEP
jgi:FtsP/CotA-like multicopper oxidase with cupredoxin domain